MKLLHLLGEIDPITAAPVIRSLDAATPEDELVVLKISSPGGWVDYGQAIIASMGACAVPVHTFASGFVGSAAVDVLAMGIRRGVHPLAYGMTHSSNTKVVAGKECAAIEFARDKLMFATNPAVLENWSFLFGKRKRWHRPEDLVKYGLADYVADRPRLP